MNIATSDRPHDEGATAYADRPYERNLAESGRKFISIDLDEELVRAIDRLRGNQRRGLQVDALIRQGLGMEAPAMT